MSQTTNIVDIAIVGAGLSGLSCAVALANSSACDGMTIRVFERTSRQGGRVFSTQLNDSMVEMGAGRYSSQLHPTVHQLIKSLGKSIEPFPFTKLSFNRNLSMDLKDTLADLKELITEHPQLSFFEFVSLYKGIEEAKYIIRSLGYKALFLENITAEIGFDVIEKHPETQIFTENAKNSWYCAEDGFGSIVQDLYDETLSRGVLFSPEYNLKNVDSNTDGNLLTFDNKGRHISIKCNNVILAIPPSAMKRINVDFPSAWTPFEFSSLPLFKGFFYYKDSWWKDRKLEDHFVVTDNPLSKIYFKGDKHVFFYTDSEDAEYWHNCILEGEETYLENIKCHLADALDCDESLMGEIDTHHFKYWSKGVEFATDSSPLQPLALKSRNGIIACSDAYTSHCGWMEGSLTSAKAASNLLIQSIEELNYRLPVEIYE